MNTRTRARATCHPDRPAEAKGLCKTCYNRERIFSSPVNRAKHYASAKSWRERNRDKVREIQVQYLYGVSAADYDAFVKKHEGICPICRTRPTKHLDHDHETGKLRGLLCGQCNIGLGALQDDPEILERAARYLREGVSAIIEDASVDQSNQLAHHG